MSSFDKLEEWCGQGPKKERRNWEVGSSNSLVELRNELQEPYCELSWVLHGKKILNGSLVSVTEYGKTPDIAVENALAKFKEVYGET